MRKSACRRPCSRSATSASGSTSQTKRTPAAIAAPQCTAQELHAQPPGRGPPAVSGRCPPVPTPRRRRERRGERMGYGERRRLATRRPRRVAPSELGLQVLPFVLELTAGDRNPGGWDCRADEVAVEPVGRGPAPRRARAEDTRQRHRRANAGGGTGRAGGGGGSRGSRPSAPPGPAAPRATGRRAPVRRGTRGADSRFACVDRVLRLPDRPSIRAEHRAQTAYTRRASDETRLPRDR